MRNPFRRKPVMPVMQTSMDVIIISPEEEGQTEQLGITPERAQELWDAMHAIVNDTEKYTSVVQLLAAISKHCKHPNELAWLSSAMMCHLQRRTNPMAMIIRQLFSE